jgi:hypothetical protein
LTEPRKKKWEVVISNEDGTEGGDFPVMAFTAEEAREDALTISPAHWTKVVTEPKEIN